MNIEFMKTSAIVALIAAIVFAGGMFTGAKSCNPRRTSALCPEIVSKEIRIDTVSIPVPQPARVEVVEKQTTVLRRDTAYIVSADSCAVEIPITEKEYITPEFRATVKGYEPELLNVFVYPKTITVTKIKKPRFSLIAGAGIGWNGQRITPQIGVSAGFILWSK